MATIIRLKKRQAHKLSECAEKVYKSAKKLMTFIEEEIVDPEELDERYDGGGQGGSGGGGNFRDEEDWDEEDEDDEDDEGMINKRRGVPGTGRYGKRRYGRRRRY